MNSDLPIFQLLPWPIVVGALAFNLGIVCYAVWALIDWIVALRKCAVVLRFPATHSGRGSTDLDRPHAAQVVAFERRIW